MKYTVSILKSSKDGGYYYGYTSDLEARLLSKKALFRKLCICKKSGNISRC